MESTTLEQAAESLLATSEEVSAGGDNLDAAVDEITEPDDDQVEVAIYALKAALGEEYKDELVLEDSGLQEKTAV